MGSASIRLKKGVSLASESLVMIWRHKTFLLYLAIPALISISIMLISYNLLLMQPQAQHTPFLLGMLDSIELIRTMPEWARQVSMAVLFFLITCMSIYFDVALVIHTYTVLKRNVIGFLDSLKAATLYWYPIMLWALVTTGGVLLSKHATQWMIATVRTNPIFLVFLVFLGLLGLIWLFLTFFVIQIIVLEKETSLIRMITKSAQLSRQTLLIIVGGWLWFSILFFIVAVPLDSILMLFAHGGLLALIIGTVSLILRYTFATAQIIFKTLCYHHYHLPPDSTASRRD